MFVSFNSNTTGNTREAGSAYISRGSEFTPGEVRVAKSLIVCSGLLFIVCLFVLVLLVIALSVHHLHTALFERHAKHYRFSSTIFKSKSRWIRM
jgi:hypothetical protein